MTEKLVELDPSKDEQELEEKVYGVAVAKVISNLDATGEGRVQLSLPWLPGFEASSPVRIGAMSIAILSPVCTISGRQPRR